MIEISSSRIYKKILFIELNDLISRYISKFHFVLKVNNDNFHVKSVNRELQKSKQFSKGETEERLNFNQFL